MINKIRIDKFLWCIRLFKTRKLSNQACSKSKVKVDDRIVKSSYLVKKNDIIKIKKKIILVSIKIKDLTDKRVAAKLVNQYVEDITPDSEKIKIKISNQLPHSNREKGLGRPTKKERRDLMRGLEKYSKY
tara:strand:+ start:2118 stop:2507 length:390 start_codon:yes stop_codon:yes gene_type:complete